MLAANPPPAFGAYAVRQLAQFARSLFRRRAPAAQAARGPRVIAGCGGCFFVEGAGARR